MNGLSYGLLVNCHADAPIAGAAAYRRPGHSSTLAGSLRSIGGSMIRPWMRADWATRLTVWRRG